MRCCAGKFKLRNNPLQPQKPEDVAWRQELLDQIHANFIDLVKDRRGKQLEAANAPLDHVFSGEVFVGALSTLARRACGISDLYSALLCQARKP